MSEKAKASKEKFLKIAESLMMQRGYNATTVEEICKIAELTKGAFFYHFKTKEDLGIAVLHYYWQRRKEAFSQVNWQEGAEPLEQLGQFLEIVADVFMNDPNGCSCLAGSFSQELASQNPLFQAEIVSLFEEWKSQIKPSLEKAKATSTKAQALNTDSLADYIIALVEGTLILALARQDKRLIAQQLQMLQAHLQTLF
jgi:TetR/AcrR family transcriptional regulator, transcriptional repressor for nem operon